MEFSWRPGIGDPTLLGWITVACYFLAAASAYMVVRRLVESTPAAPYREILIWRALVVLLLILGINKQLDLQSALTEIGRILARQHGWYENRNIVQLVFVSGVAMAGALVAIASVILLRAVAYQTWVALLGANLVLTFVIIRAASFHHVDVFISTRIASIRWNVILEIGGLLIILIGAWLRMLAAKKQEL
jgi:hypothetical protein